MTLKLNIVPPENVPASPESVLPSREEIAAAGQDLAAAADGLSASISAIEDYLETQNFAIPVWVKVKGWSDDDYSYWLRELGYDLLNGSWHLLIREKSGNEQWPDRENVITWSFKNSPRKARISASDKIPDLLKELIKESARTARRLREKTVEVDAFVSTLKIAAAKKAKR